jgi:hypothetical protein
MKEEKAGPLFRRSLKVVRDRELVVSVARGSGAAVAKGRMFVRAIRDLGREARRENRGAVHAIVTVVLNYPPRVS